MRVSKLFAVLVVLSLLLSPLASFPVQASDPNDPDGDDDNDSDGYDSNQDGEISDEEKYTNLEEYYNNTNPNDVDRNVKNDVIEDIQQLFDSFFEASGVAPLLAQTFSAPVSSEVSPKHK